jgi:apolipoprotein N-acyltransferase
MLSLTIVVLVTAAAGFIVWANDKRHTKYGMVLPAGVAVGGGTLSWIILMAAGFGYRPGLTWLPWVLPIALGSAAAVAAVLYLGRIRAKRDLERLTVALKL